MPIRPENVDRYPPDWPLISDRIRFERAKGRCECRGECGHDHKEEAGRFFAAILTPKRCLATHNHNHPMTGSMVTLTTAHLDDTPENSDNPGGVFVALPLEESNLRAMCQRCHLNYDRHIHVANARETRERRREQIGLW